jgi:hypothetical protein
MGIMRRALSILLIALFGLTPFVALAQSSGSMRLPVCCRRRGAHHCDMPEDAVARIVAASSGKTPTIGAPLRCPLYPGALHATLTPVYTLAPRDSAPAVAHTSERVFSSSAPHADSSFSSGHAVRGPPDAVLGS